MTPYASYPMTRELPPISNRRVGLFGVAAGLCVAVGLIGPFFVERQLSNLRRALDLVWLTETLLGPLLVLLCVAGFPACCTSLALRWAAHRRHCTQDAGFRLLAIAFATSVAAIWVNVFVSVFRKVATEDPLWAFAVSVLAATFMSFTSAMAGAFLCFVPAHLANCATVRALNRREAAALRRRQRRYFDGREKQMLATVSPTPWRETRKGFHTMAALCGLICTIGLTAAAGLMEFAIHGSSFDGGLGYALLTLFVWPALVVCIGAKVLGCGATRSWNDGILLAVGAYVWSVVTFTLGALLALVVSESSRPLISALHFGVASALFGAVLSLLPCFAAVTGCAIISEARRARTAANLLHIRRRRP